MLDSLMATPRVAKAVRNLHLPSDDAAIGGHAESEFEDGETLRVTIHGRLASVTVDGSYPSSFVLALYADGSNDTHTVPTVLTTEATEHMRHMPISAVKTIAAHTLGLTLSTRTALNPSADLSRTFDAVTSGAIVHLMENMHAAC